MWTSEAESLEAGRVRRYRLFRHGEPTTYDDVLDLWQRDDVFRAYFIGLLAGAPYAAYRWETPAVSRETRTREFEFALLDSPYLDVPVDSEAFANHFDAAGNESVIEFPNLGGDAILIVPCPRASASAYGHLGAFLRGAPDEQQHALWRMVGATMRRRLAERPLWLSTAGGGVAWLHVRLDARPKYYGFRPYTAAE